MQQGKPAGVFPRHRAHSVRGTLSGAVSSERCRVYGEGQYGCVGQGLHIAKKLLPYIPNNAGILLVPCCRGGSAFTQGTEGTFSESTGASQDSARWGVGKPLYQDLLFRTKAALQKNPKNVLLAICWMQGEFDMTNASYAQQPASSISCNGTAVPC